MTEMPSAEEAEGAAALEAFTARSNDLTTIVEALANARLQSMALSRASMMLYQSNS